MHIGVDVQAEYGARTGLGVYVNSLCQAFRNVKAILPQFSFFYSELLTGNLNTPQRLYWENIELVKKIKSAGIDLLHVPAFALPFTKTCPTVLTVHDLIGVKFENQKGLPSRFYWKQWLPASIKRADRIIAISEHTKKDIVECLGIPHSKIKVVYPSGHESFRSDVAANFVVDVKQRLGIRECYFLCVGSFEPRKNLKRVIKAFGIFLKKSFAKDMQLVLVGPQDFARGEYFVDLCSRFGVNQNQILATGFVNHDTLNTLYFGACALIFVSLYEGFGLPLLEAMASNCPIVAANRTSLPEIAGNAALFVDPENTEAIAGAMRDLYISPSLRSSLIDYGQRRMLDFSWKKCAVETIKVYEEVMSESF